MFFLLLWPFKQNFAEESAKNGEEQRSLGKHKIIINPREENPREMETPTTNQNCHAML